MTVETILARLEALGSDKVRRINERAGAGPNQFGVKMGDIRKLAKEIAKEFGRDRDLALSLWQTGNIEARFLAILLLKPADLTADEADALVRSNDFAHVADWLSAYILKTHPAREELRLRWMQDPHPFAARAGWSLTADLIARSPDGLDLTALLDRIEAEMADAPPPVQWTMNMALAHVGIHHPAQRDRALAIGEALGVFRDYPTPKGCTSPFAPLWIGEMVRRQG